MIVQLALAAALTFAPPLEDVQLPTCAIGEEAQPFEDGYVCGPADPAVPELELPSPGPVFTAEPAPWPGPTETPAAPAQPAPANQPAAPATAPPALAETGVAEERITSLSVFAAIAIALGAGIVLTLMLRRGSSIDRGFDDLRDENGYYTKLKPSDPGYPYGPVDVDARFDELFDALSTPAIPGETHADLRDENGFYTKFRPTDPGYPYGNSASDSSDAALDALGAPTIPGQTIGPGGVDAAGGRVSGLPQEVHLGSKGAERRRLRLGETDSADLVTSSNGESSDVVGNAHENSPSVLDVEVAPSTSSDQTVGDAADTAVMGSFPLGSQQERRRMRGGGDDAAAPHSTQGGTQ